MESSSGAVQGSRRGRLLIDPESIPHDPEFSAQRLREQAVAGAPGRDYTRTARTANCG